MFDNSENEPHKIAYGAHTQTEVVNAESFKDIKKKVGMI